MVPVRRRLLPALLAVGLAACGSGEAASPEPDSTVGGVGALPSELPPRPTDPASVPETSEPTETTDESSPDTTTPTTDPADERVPPVGRLVDGNRVLVIGDSILASISDRHGGQLCDRLVPRGWEVEVNAQTGQHIEYGRQVLRGGSTPGGTPPSSCSGATTARIRCSTAPSSTD